ncbi:MAG: bifunctional oligoribonuclease/PAP phosphatase NrnA [Akkermansia sp.]
MNQDLCPTLQQIRDVIRDHDRFVVIAHFRPDGDAIGATIALGLALRSMGKKVFLLNEDPVPAQLRFLKGSELIEQTPDCLIDADVAISLDNGARKRLGERSLRALANVPIWLNIDHHETNDHYGNICYIHPDKCATCAIIYDMLKAMNITFTPEIRDAIYAGVSTDTGSFQYEKTTPEVMDMAADLLRMGVKVQDINRKLYQETSWGKLMLTKEVLNGMRRTPDQLIAYFCLTQACKDNIHATEDDTEGLIDMLRSILGVKLAAIFEEMQDGRIRISLRSKDPALSVSAVAASFGGGGHSMAAGIRMPGSITDARDKVIAALQESIEANRDHLSAL